MPSHTFRSLVRKCLSSPEKTERSIPSDRKSSFWTLPPELRNVIFEEAYGGGHVKKVRSTRLALAERKKSKCVIEHLLVSKQWFSEAVSIFAHSTTFEFSSFADIVYVADRLPKYITNHVSSISWHSEQLRRLDLDGNAVEKLMEELPALRSISISVNSMLMIQKATNYRLAITRDKLDNSDIALVQGFEALRKFRGLCDFQFYESQDVLAMRRYYPADRLAIWVQNLAAFERYILAEASKPRE